jgi:hypothetical protein
MNNVKGEGERARDTRYEQRDTRYAKRSEAYLEEEFNGAKQ